MSSVICFSLDQFKILSSGNGLTVSNKSSWSWFGFHEIHFYDHDVKMILGHFITLSQTISDFYIPTKKQKPLLNPFPNKPWFLLVCSASF